MNFNGLFLKINYAYFIRLLVFQILAIIANFEKSNNENKQKKNYEFRSEKVKPFFRILNFPEL